MLLEPVQRTVSAGMISLSCWLEMYVTCDIGTELPQIDIFKDAAEAELIGNPLPKTVASMPPNTLVSGGWKLFTTRGIVSRVSASVSAYPTWETKICGANVPAGSRSEPSAFAEIEQVKLERVPEKLTQGTPDIVMLRSLSCSPMEAGSDIDI